MYSAEEILKRLALVLRATSDTEMASALGTAKSTVANWRYRNSVPWEKCLEVAETHGVSLDWLLLGRPQREYSVEERRPVLEDVEASEVEGSELEAVAAFSKMEAQWRVLQRVEQAPATVAEIVADTGLQLQIVRGALLLAQRQGIVKHVGEQWISARHPELVSQSMPDMAAHIMQVTSVMNHMGKQLEKRKAAIISAEIQIAGDGADLLNSLKESIVKHEQVNAKRRLSVVIAVSEVYR